MPVTLQTVNASDLIDNGRTKFNSNDTTLSAANAALAAQLTAHSGEGHPALYYSKSEVDALVDAHTVRAKKVPFYFGYDVANDKNLFSGVADAFPVMPGAGEIRTIIVTAKNIGAIVLEYTPGQYPVAEGDRLSIVGSTDLLPGDEVVPLRGGILLTVTGTTNNYQIIVYTSPVLGFPNVGNFAIMVEVALT